MAKNSSNDVVPTTEMMESPEGTSRGEKNKEEEKKQKTDLTIWLACNKEYLVHLFLTRNRFQTLSSSTHHLPLGSVSTL